VPGAAELQKEIYVPAMDMVSTIVQLILLPLLAGMAFRRRLPKVTERIKQPIRVLSMMIFISFILFAVYANYDNIVNYLHIVFLLVFTHNAFALMAGYWWAKTMKLPKRDARAISIETGIQNSGLALILIFNFFDGLGGMALIAAWWGIWHLVSAFTLSMWWQQRPLTISSKLIEE